MPKFSSTAEIRLRCILTCRMMESFFERFVSETQMHVLGRLLLFSMPTLELGLWGIDPPPFSGTRHFFSLDEWDLVGDQNCL
ncbi:hypothetical protein VTN00DRAFT_1350 [Thermoascus crustaceus]|uniref:uncharacterized protein n=1 Tax=Thermoascus crustaceus TaxID=5088 RepID=UPI003742BAD8